MKPTFKDFMIEVNSELKAQLGCTRLDLPDFPYREAWEETEEELAYIAPEDVEHWSNVYRRNVLYTVEDVVSENAIDLYPYEQGVDY